MRRKYIYIKMADNTYWKLPCDIIANYRALYYEVNENYLYDEIYDETINDDKILIDWMSNNISFDDIKDEVILVKKEDINYDNNLINNNKFIMLE